MRIIPNTGAGGNDRMEQNSGYYVVHFVIGAGPPETIGSLEMIDTDGGFNEKTLQVRLPTPPSASINKAAIIGFPTEYPLTTARHTPTFRLMATLKIPESIAPASEDAESLRKAFEGWLTNGNIISSILAHRNASQRKAIQDAYRQAYGRDLLSVIDKELSSDFERLVMVWTMVPAERDAFLVNEATKMMSKSNWVIMEVGCARSSHDLFMARHAYHDRFKRSMEEDVAYHTSGPFRQLLVPLVTAFRYEGPEVNTTLARKEAKILREKISDKAYTDEEFIRIISTRSKSQFNATINHYNDEFGNSITKDLKSDPEDEFLRLLRAAIKCLTRPEKYFEKVLRKAIIGLGTDEWALTRVVATRAEVDMLRIKEEYLRRNSQPLHKAIHGDTSGDYRNMLLTLVGRGDDE